MPLVIDTFNVLHTTGVLPAEAAGIDVDDLIALLQISRYRRHRITMVCDGSGRDHQEPGVCGGVTVRYSGRGRPADEIIIDLIRTTTAPRQLLVISSDQEILRAAKRRRCPTLKSESFLKQIAKDLKTAPPRPRAKNTKRQVNPIPRAEVRHWIDAFGLKEHELKMPSSLLPPPPPPPKVKRELDDERGEERAAPKRKAPKDALPDDVIGEAEAMWRAQPKRKKPAKKSKANKQPMKRAKPLSSEETEARDNGRSKADTRKLRETRVDRLSEEDAANMDLSELMADVDPLDEKERM